MTLSVHWFLPTAGDSRDVVGFGPTARRGADLDYLDPGGAGRRGRRLRRRADAHRHVVRGRLDDHRALIPETTRLRFLVAFRPGSCRPRSRPSRRHLPTAVGRPPAAQRRDRRQRRGAAPLRRLRSTTTRATTAPPSSSRSCGARGAARPSTSRRPLPGRGRHRRPPPTRSRRSSSVARRRGKQVAARTPTCG